MVSRSRTPNGAYEYIDATADVQQEEEDLVLDAGIANLKVLYSDGRLTMPVTLSIQNSTGFQRGVHMSRLVRAANSRGQGGIEAWLR